MDSFEKIYSESRTTRISTTPEYINDLNKLDFKTNENGIFEGTHILKHNTSKDEKVVFYAVMENGASPLLITLNGKKGYFHMIDVPKCGEVQLNYSLSNIPAGKQMIYLFTEKYFDDYKHSDEWEKRHSNWYITHLYFSLDVKGANPAPVANHLYVVPKRIEKPTQKGLPITIYKDKNLFKEADELKEGTYYLSINNKYDREMQGQLMMMTDYTVGNSQKLFIPAFSKIIIPFELKKESLIESIRFILLGIPTKDYFEAPRPIRIVQGSHRLPVE
ncbi:hypothetical protein [Niallia sp. 01092]|uniref:hypothetical protein n=1 Tax=unclassified Niallia TaxID=2837522 RepID=UPI003FCF74F8